MSTLKLPFASEVCESKKRDSANVELCLTGFMGYNSLVLRVYGSYGVQKRSMVKRNGTRYHGFFANNGEEESSGLLKCAVPAGKLIRSHVGKSLRSNPVRVIGLEGAGEFFLTNGAVEEHKPDKAAGDDFTGFNVLPQSVIPNLVKLQKKVPGNNVQKKNGRKMWSRLMAVRGDVPGDKVSVKREEYNPVQENADIKAYLSAIGPQTTVQQWNSILKILEQNNGVKMLDFFELMRSNGKLKRNTVAYAIALKVLVRKHDWFSVEALFQEMTSNGCEVDCQVFNTLILLCTKTKDAEMGSRLFRMMWEKGIHPNSTTFGTLMVLYQKVGNVSEAEFTFSKMRNHRVRCAAAYSAMITIYTRSRQYDKSESIISIMDQDKIQPNLENWLVRINAYSQQGKLDKAESVLKSMRKAGVSPNIVAYNTLITGYGKISDTDAATRLFQSLEGFGLKPDETTYRSMIEGFGRADKYEEAKQYYERLKNAGFRPNSSNLYTMINLQAKHGDDDGSVQTLKDMRLLNCQYSSILTILLQAYERVGRVNRVPSILKSSFYENILADNTSCSLVVMVYVKASMLDDALDILRERKWRDSSYEDNLYHLLICSCKESGNYESAIKIFKQMVEMREDLNLHVVSSMIDIYGCMGRFHEAEDLFLNLKASGIPLDMVAYSILVRMYVKSGSLKDACSVLDMMEKQKDVVPDTFLYRDMLRIYQKCGMHEKLSNLYYRMLKRGLTWDESMYSCVINCCARALPVDEVSRLFDEMLQHGYTPSTLTFNIMLDIYGKSGFLQKVRKLLLMARKQGLTDVISYNTAIAAYGKNKDFRSMQSVVHQMQNAGYPVTLEAYNCMLDAYGKSDQLEEFNNVLKKMEESRCHSDHYTYNILINIYGKKGWTENVANVLAELRGCGLEPDLYGYNTLIKVYGIAGMVEEAMGLLKEMRTKQIEPDRVTYINLIQALQRNEEFLEAVKWSLWMKQMGLLS